MVVAGDGISIGRVAWHVSHPAEQQGHCLKPAVIYHGVRDLTK